MATPSPFTAHELKAALATIPVGNRAGPEGDHNPEALFNALMTAPGGGLDPRLVSFEDFKALLGQSGWGLDKALEENYYMHVSAWLAQQRGRREFLPLAAGVTAAVATPVTVVAGVGALGFGSGGIVAGSTAAGWMATGAGTTPYLVGVGQAIGATGSLFAGAGMAATVGLAGGAFFAAYKGIKWAQTPRSQKVTQK